jgi:hypothetical protein
MIFGESSRIIGIHAFCRTRGVPDLVLEELSLAGVRLSLSSRKDASDQMLLSEMMLFALDHQPPSNILLISGDPNFSNALLSLKQRGYRIVLVFPEHASPLLMRVPHVLVPWSDVVKNIEQTGSKNSELELETDSSANFTSSSFASSSSAPPKSVTRNTEVKKSDHEILDTESDLAVNQGDPGLYGAKIAWEDLTASTPHAMKYQPKISLEEPPTVEARNGASSEEQASPSSSSEHTTQPQASEGAVPSISSFTVLMRNDVTSSSVNGGATSSQPTSYLQASAFPAPSPQTGPTNSAILLDAEESEILLLLQQ